MMLEPDDHYASSAVRPLVSKTATQGAMDVL